MNGEQAAGGKIRVLVVDDSATVRAVLTRELAKDAGIEILGYAKDGLDALEKIAALKPDVVTMDIEMPRMDGLQALERIMQERPTPVVMVSSLTKEGADATIRALELGAVDFIAKANSMGSAGLSGIIDELIEKVKAAASVKPHSVLGLRARLTSISYGQAGPGRWRRVAVVIGSSTGGPQALRTVLTAMPPDLGAPVFVVQHMPPGFTRALAERLDTLGPLRVEEARPGSRAEGGKVLLAPGGFHMTLRANGEAELNQQPPECGVRPAVNVTMESVVKVYGASTIGVVLTGMGHDGTRGAQLIKAAGGQIIAEDESTCVVYGMPRSVVEAGLVDRIVPLHRIADAVAHMCREHGLSEVPA